MTTLKWRLLRAKYRADKKFDKKVGTFHKTQFTFSQSWRMLVVFIVLYVIGAMGMRYISTAEHMTKVTASYMIYNFVIMELIPIIVVGLWFGCLSLYRHGHKEFFQNAWSEIKKWTTRFAVDLWKHKLFLLGLVVSAFIIEIIASRFTSVVLLGGHTTVTKNNKIIMQLMRQNAGFLFATDIIAPIAEELVFRFWLVKVASHILVRVFSGHGQRFAYAVGVIFSAVYFASLHMKGQSMLMSGSYIIMALFYQFLQKRSQSLTAPVLVHSIYNSILTGITLI